MDEEINTGEIRRLTREQTVADLGGIAEVAQELGVQPARVKRWIDRRDVRTPEPVKPLRGLRLYSIKAWREWYKLWRATRGRDGEAPPVQEAEDG